MKRLTLITLVATISLLSSCSPKVLEPLTLEKYNKMKGNISAFQFFAPPAIGLTLTPVKPEDDTLMPDEIGRAVTSTTYGDILYVKHGKMGVVDSVDEANPNKIKVDFTLADVKLIPFVPFVVGKETYFILASNDVLPLPETTEESEEDNTSNQSSNKSKVKEMYNPATGKTEKVADIKKSASSKSKPKQKVAKKITNNHVTIDEKDYSKSTKIEDEKKYDAKYKNYYLYYWPKQADKAAKVISAKGRSVNGKVGK